MSPRLAVLPDLAVVLAFVTIGRMSHDEALSPSGWAHTAWPFLVGLALGYLAARGLRLHPVGMRAGVTCWASALVAGMLLRHFAENEGTPVSFVIVAATFLAFGLLGWRVLARARAARLAA